MASDPMALRRGGKKLPMEDVCYHQWPLPGVDQVIVPFFKEKIIKSGYSAVDCIFLFLLFRYFCMVLKELTSPEFLLFSLAYLVSAMDMAEQRLPDLLAS